MSIDTPRRHHPDGPAGSDDVQVSALEAWSAGLPTDPPAGALPDQPDDTPRGLPWMGDDKPACIEPGAAELFQLAGDLHDATRLIHEAKQVCWRCPYLTPCADWAIRQRERWGVWGGLTYLERREIRSAAYWGGR